MRRLPLARRENHPPSTRLLFGCAKLTFIASPAQFAFKRLAPQSGLLSEDLRIMAEHLGGAALEAYEAAMRRVESEGAFNPLEEALSPADHAQAAQARL